MARIKEKNLRRFVALYLTSSMLLSGVAFAGENEDESFYADGTPIVVEEGNLYDGMNEVYGGSNVYIEEGDSNITSTNITVKSGDVGSITGGSAAEDGKTAYVAASNIKVNGGNVSYIVGGGEACADGAASTVETVNINIKGGVFNEQPYIIEDEPGSYNGLVGGGLAWAGDDESGINTANVKTVNITIDSGTFLAGVPDTAILGGGVAADEGSNAESGSKAVAHVDTVNMNINGGSIATDIYAGGYAYGDDAASTVDNATINISNGDIKGNVYAGGKGTATVENSTINISGGKIGGNISAEQNVTGSSALNFTAGTGSNIDGAVSGFDTVTVKSGAKTTFSGANVADGTAAIQAKALNIEENSTVTVAKNMTFNLGSASAPIPASFSLRSARVANGMLNLSGELKIVTGAELTLENTTLVSQNTGMVTVGAKKDGSTISVGKLNMAANSDFADNHMNLNIGLPIDVIKNLSAAEINDIIEQSLAPTIANGLDLNSLDISNGTNAEYQYIKDASGKIVDVKLNDTYLGFYTGVRQANAYIAKNMIGNIHDRNTALRSGEKANDFWVNIRGGKTDIDNQYGKAEVKNQYYQLGYDWDVSSGDDKAVVGVYFSKIYGDITQYSIKSDIDNAYDFGIYGMKEFSNGTYLGLVSRYGQTKNSAKIDDRKVDWKDKGYALSAEFGKRMAQPNGWSMEPYMQLTYNHLSDADLNTGNTDVTLEGSNLLDGKVGVRFIKQEQENQNNNIYAGISYARGLSGDFKMNSRSGMNMTKMDNDTNSFELALGMNRQISKCSTVNLNAKKEFGDYDGWSVQGMVNVNF